MIKKLRIVTVVGTRPEIIRLSRVISALDESCDHVLIHTDQNFDFELSEIFFSELGIREPDFYLSSTIGSNSPSQTIGNLISSIDKVLVDIEPQALLVLGDTNSCLAAIAAKKRKVPVFHMEAGNRCFDQRVPEETNRKIIDHLADINMPYSDIAREYLLREGIPPDRIIKTGSPMLEVLAHHMNKIQSSNILKELELDPGGYYLISVHREENVDCSKSFNRFLELLNELAEEFALPVIVSTHPRTRKRIAEFGKALNERVVLSKPFGFFDYVWLQINAKTVLSDSGTITEESSILDFPALNLREAHERPEGMEEGSVMMVGMNIVRIKQALTLLDSQQRSSERNFRLVGDYDAPNVSKKVIRIIYSYVDYVDQQLWRKD